MLSNIIMIQIKYTSSNMASHTGRVLVYGGKGALGSTCVSFLKKQNYWVGSIDLFANEAADANILVKKDSPWTEQEKDILEAVRDVCGEEKLDGLLCVAGGWAGGNAASSEFIPNADLMWKQSVWSSAIAAAIASKYLNEGGVLTLPGAMPALKGTAGMIGYGMAKAAVHQLTKSLACKNSGMPKNSLVVALLPVTLDTPMNRKFNPDADYSTWTPLEEVAKKFQSWIAGEDRPDNGSLMTAVTRNNETVFAASQ